MTKAIKTTEYGAPSAVLNFSRMGYKYYRMFFKVDKRDMHKLTQEISANPSVNWIISADEGGGWNFAVGLLAKDNREVFDAQKSIKRLLYKRSELVSVSELVGAWFFPNHPQKDDDISLQFIEPELNSPELTPLEWDYLKLISLDVSMLREEIARLLNTTEQEVMVTHAKLEKQGIIIGEQRRFNFSGNYYKIIIDTGSVNDYNKLKQFKEGLFKNPNLIYAVDSLGQCDFEIEIYADSIEEIKELMKDFTSYSVATNFKYLHQMPFPVGKTANMLELKETIESQSGTEIDMLNSKTWYLNASAVESYLALSDEAEYASNLKTDEVSQIKEAADFYVEHYADKKQLINVVDMGSGNGLVGKTVTKALGVDRIKAYYPVDIQPVELMTVVDNHKDMPYKTKPVVVDFEKMYTRFPLHLSPEETQLYIFFGSTYGNFKIDEINGYINSFIKDTDNKMIVHMAIYDLERHSEDIVKAYSGVKVCEFVSGQLLQLGFKKEDFEQNKLYPEIITTAYIENSCLVIKMTLKRDVKLFGKTFIRGTNFKVSSSRKMSAQEFKSALERSFNIDFFSQTSSSAIAIIGAKR